VTRLLALAALLVAACADDYEGQLRAFEGSELPVLVLDTRGASIPDEPKVGARLRIHAPPVSGLPALSEAPAAVDTEIGIERRGYTSQEFPKRQYGFELRGGERQLPLLGLPEGENWVLHAPFMDKSLMRNALGYELSRRMGRYAPRTRFAELFLLDHVGKAPGLDEYRGLYVLTERVERGPNRVDLEALDASVTGEPDLAGGYLLEWTQRKRVKPGEVMFATQHAEALLIDYPRPQDVSAAETAWIRAYVEGFEAALALLSSDPDSDAFESFFDLDAGVDYVLLSELVRNQDVFVASTFVHKPRAGRLVLGPVWDLDRAFGDVEFDGNWRATGWLLPSRGWARELFLSTRFRQRYVERWRAHRRAALDTGQLLQLIAGNAQRLEAAAARNFEKWHVLGRYVKANRKPYARTFAAEIEKLSAWLEERASWIDDHIGEL